MIAAAELMNATSKIQQQLVARIAELEFENRALREALIPPVQFPKHWALTPQEALILSSPSKHRLCSGRMLRLVASERAQDKVAGCSDNVVKVLISRIRQKLRPHGIEIHGVWGVGYQLLPGTQEVVREAALEQQ